MSEPPPVARHVVALTQDAALALAEAAVVYFTVWLEETPPHRLIISTFNERAERVTPSNHRLTTAYVVVPPARALRPPAP